MTGAALERLELARVARGEGRFDDALGEHLWFHQHALADDPGLHGVRLSFALADWAALAAEHAPARAALDAARDRAADRLLSGDADWATFAEVAAIDDVLGERHRTHELFRRLDAEQPQVARECGDLAVPVLVEQGDHALARRYLGDPATYVRRRAELLTIALDRQPADRARRAAHTRYDTAVDRLVRVLTAVGEHDTARAARDLARGLTEDT